MSKKSIIYIIIAVSAVALISGVALVLKEKQEKPQKTEKSTTSPQQPGSQPATQLKAKTSPDVTEKEKPELKSTVFNKDKDVWGWSSGRYIVLHWNRYAFTLFNIYRKTDKNTQWNLANLKPLEKAEFFDSDIADYNKIIYKIEAINEKRESLKFYSPVVVHICNF